MKYENAMDRVDYEETMGANGVYCFDTHEKKAYEIANMREKKYFDIHGFFPELVDLQVESLIRNLAEKHGFEY